MKGISYTKINPINNQYQNLLNVYKEFSNKIKKILYIKILR
jgi:hypothetical protein